MSFSPNLLMIEKEHIEAAKQWEDVAEKHSELKYIVPQAYFYSAINYIEAILAKRNLHPRTHEERHSMMRDINGFDASDREFHENLLYGRREVGYRGRNGDKLRKIKNAYDHFRKKWQS